MIQGLNRAGLVALLLVVLVGGFVIPATHVEAQRVYPDECYDIHYETSTVVFNGTPIQQKKEVGRTLKDECITPPDNRINHMDNYAAATIYCTASGVSIWDLDDLSRGTFSFLATYDEIGAIPKFPQTNTLIKEHGGFGLYRLTSGELQLNSPPDWQGKSYVFVWQDCDPVTGSAVSK